MNFYGQLITGAPGAGKTTYCDGLTSILKSTKRRYVCINLDPANDLTPFKPDIDIRELISVEYVMKEIGLGPNGALRYCMKTLAKNLKWLLKRLEGYSSSYLIFDMPGQLELYTCDDSMRQIVEQFRKWKWNLCAVHLNDSIYASDPGKFISVVLSSLIVMVNLELPQINVLSKVDSIPSDAPYNLEYFEQLPDLKYLAQLLDDNPILRKYKKLNENLCELVDDYSLVSFLPLDVQDKEKMLRLLKMADNANGFNFVDVKDFRNMFVKDLL